MIFNGIKNIFGRFTAFFAILFAICLLISSVSTAIYKAEIDPVKQAEAMLSEITVFASGSEGGAIDEWINGRLSADPPLNEWYAIGISRLYSDAKLAPYAASLESYLENNTVYSATTRQKYGLVLIACGRGDSDYLIGLVDDTAGKQGIMSYVFALHLLTNGASSEKYSPQNIIPVILSLACEGGGWSLTGKSPDVDVTAMTVQALAPYYNAYDEVKAAVDAAVERLSSMQAADGGFSSYGEANPESAAQVIIALTSLGREPLADSAFMKGGNTPLDAIKSYRLSDGSYSHRLGDVYNHAATAQVFLALSALVSDTGGGEPFFMFVSAPTEFPMLDSSVADTLPDKNTGGSGGNGESGSEGEQGGGETENGEENIGSDGENTVNPQEKASGAYKLPVCIVIGVLAAMVCALMFLKKKRALSDYIIVVVAAAAICLAVVFIDVYTPEEYYGQAITKEDPIGTVTVEIVCDSELTGRSDAVILKKTAIEIEAGESVYDLLAQACRSNEIVLDAMAGSPTGGVYVRGIDGLHEFAHGELSGWTYTVNGDRVSIGSDKYLPKDGDVIVWSYSDAMGE